MADFDANSLWESVLAELQLTLSGANFQTWFKGNTSVLSIQPGVVNIGCASPYNKVWIEERYLGQLKEIVDRLTSADNTLTFSVVSQTPSKPKGKKARQENPTVPLFEDTDSQIIQESLESSHINKRYSFSNFIVGQSNQLAYAVAQAVVETPVKHYNPVLFYGGVGVGKTHLLQAIGQAVLLRKSKVRVLYCSGEAFTNDMVEAIQKRQTSSFRSKYRDVDFLLVDDIQFIAGRESTQEQFFHTFNELYGQGRQVVLSCDRDPSELADLQERLKNRFIGGMVAKIDPPDLELREAILLSKAKTAGIDIERPVIRLLAENLGPSVRELEGGLLRVAAVSRLIGKRVDLSLIKTTVGLVDKSKKPLRTVLEEVAGFFSLPVAELKGASRSRACVLPRQIAMYLMRKEMGLSFKDTAAALGGKDHTTAIYSINKVEGLVDEGGEIARVVRELRSRVFGC